MPWQTGGGGAYGSLGKMLAGSLGGVCGVVATYPLDTLRARLAVHPKAGMHFFLQIFGIAVREANKQT